MRGPLLALVVFLLAPPAAGETPIESARRHYAAGSKYYEATRYVDAAEEFEAAYRAKPDPAFLYNAAQAHRLAGNAIQALHFYEEFLRKLPEAPNRREVETRIEALQPEVEAQRAAAKAPEKPPEQPAQPPVAQQPPASASTPVYRRWWFWTIIGAVVVGGTATALGLTLGSSSDPPATHFGNVDVF